MPLRRCPDFGGTPGSAIPTFVKLRSLKINSLYETVPSAPRALLQSARKYRLLAAGAVFFSLFSALFEGFSVGLIIPFLQNLQSESADTFRTGVEWVDRTLLGVGRPQLERMYRICGVIIGATWLRSIFGYFMSVFSIKAKARIIEDLRMRIVDQLQAVSLSFFSRARSGELINVFTNELQRVAQSFGVVMTFVARGSLLIVYVGIMAWISWQLTLLVIAFFVLLSIGLSRLIEHIQTSSHSISSTSGTFVSSAAEFINGIRTVTAFNMQKFERDRLHMGANRFADAVIETGRRKSLVQPLSQGVVGTILIVVVLLATHFYVLPGTLDVALLLAFLFALFRLTPIVHELNKQRGEWASFSSALSNVSALLSRHDKPYLKDGKRELGEFRDAIIFHQVGFCYEPGTPVLYDVTLRIERGLSTAIVGASGGGKSTLVDLIPRFHDPTEGNVTLDGVDLRHFKLASLRRKIAVVSQSTFIFNDTVRANIAYGAPDASMDRIRDAAEKANVLEFVDDMPEGFDTVLGDAGIRLSGGQRQRIAIARALLRDPDVLILDEATSALDSVSEKLVQQSLEGLMAGRTVVAIAHRLSTLENADRVVVLEAGRIVEEGTYEELLMRKGKLWEYHAIQFQFA